MRLVSSKIALVDLAAGPTTEAMLANTPATPAMTSASGLPHPDTVLYLLGISREYVEAAGANDPALPDDGRILRLADE